MIHSDLQCKHLSQEISPKCLKTKIRECFPMGASALSIPKTIKFCSDEQNDISQRHIRERKERCSGKEVAGAGEGGQIIS